MKDRLTVFAAAAAISGTVIGAVFFVADIKSQQSRQIERVNKLEGDMNILQREANRIGELIGEFRQGLAAARDQYVVLTDRQNAQRDFMMEMYRTTYGVRPRQPGEPPPGH